MRKLIKPCTDFCGIVFLMFLFSSCMKDKIRYTYRISTPVYETLAQFRETVKTVAAAAISSPGKIGVYGKYIFMSEAGKGIHVIDNSDPSNPKNISFINIPGNQDFAITGNVMYADCYSDLVSFDISDPSNAVAKNFQVNVFPYNSIYYGASSTDPDLINVVISWISHDTTVDYTPNSSNGYPVLYDGCANCYTLAAVPSAYAANSSAAATGTNGSLSRFTIINNYLYTVDYSNLNTFNISNNFQPASTNQVMVDYHVETIYPFKDKLFVGTNNGVYMYNIASSPNAPALQGEFTHVRGCDPVIADGNYAYVTINDSSACLGFNNELQVVNIQDMSNSFLVQSYQLTHPIGLSKDNLNLFVCDGKGGLKVFNTTDVSNLNMIADLQDAEVYDVIAANGLAIVLGKNGLYEYDYTDINNIHLISKLIN
ncbi:MAG: hypothetical protein JST96_17585 [Bacteroidetes bacterium]|nr:hypothetical protein [Bacteroidota bacterium]